MDSNTDGAEEVVADGGTPADRGHENKLSPSGAGAIAGGIAGLSIGLILGRPWIVGLAILGVMVGDELEMRILKDGNA